MMLDTSISAFQDRSSSGGERTSAISAGGGTLNLLRSKDLSTTEHRDDERFCLDLHAAATGEQQPVKQEASYNTLLSDHEVCSLSVAEEELERGVVLEETQVPVQNGTSDASLTTPQQQEDTPTKAPTLLVDPTAETAYSADTSGDYDGNEGKDEPAELSFDTSRSFSPPPPQSLRASTKSVSFRQLDDLEAGLAPPSSPSIRRRHSSLRRNSSVIFSSRTGMTFEFTAGADDTESNSASRSLQSGFSERSLSVKSSKKPKYIENAFIVFLATLLAFNSGFSNGVCLSGLLTPDDLFSRQGTSGFTGTYTKSALAVADKDMVAFPIYPRLQFIGFQFCMILSYIAGSCITGLLNPRPAAWRLAPAFAPALLLGCIFMTIASALANAEAHVGDATPHFYYFVALANGVQNGISSMYSANLIRTTHLTGTSTDIGLFLGQLMRGNTNDTWKLGLLTTLAMSFWLGGVVSFYAVRAWLQYSLFFNAAVFFLLLFLYVGFIMWNLHLPLHRAIRGTWHWQHAMHQLSFRDATNGAVQPEESLLSIFQDMDIDQSGYLDLQEFEAGLNAHGLSYLSRGDLVHMFEVCDRDGDGRISPQDWLSLIKGQNVLVG